MLVDTDVWIFFPAEQKNQSSKTRAIIRDECKKRKWQFQEREAKRVQGGGGTVRLVEFRDATAVYKRMHRARVAVLYLDQPRICLIEPEDRAIRRDRTLPLSDYCRYKSYRTRAETTAEAVLAWIREFETWNREMNCDGDSDPRCLPFHIFETPHQCDQLHTLTGRQEFESKHHSRHGGRIDSNELVWETNPRVYHAHEGLHVAGRSLTRGFHWDIQNKTGRPITIGLPSDRWVIKNYLNAFPDGTIRGSHPHAHKK